MKLFAHIHHVELFGRRRGPITPFRVIPQAGRVVPQQCPVLRDSDTDERSSLQLGRTLRSSGIS
jgi:hypothetical protein